MELGRYCFSDLGSLIDHVHGLFDRWEEDGDYPPPLDDELLGRMKLAVHEWLANLVQHADFSGRSPEIAMEVIPNGGNVHCAIEDNSSGFDLDATLSARQEVLNAFPDRGMGLLLIKSCTQDLRYRCLRPDLHRLEFVLSPDFEPELIVPFF